MDSATIFAALSEAMGGPLATEAEIERVADMIRATPIDEERLRLHAAAPLRRPQEQRDVDGLALFDAHRAPRML